MSSVDDESRLTPPRWRHARSREEIRQRRHERQPRIRQQPKRVEIRLGSEGEFVSLGGDPIAWHGRRLFLDAITQVKSQVLHDLAGELFAAFFPDFVRLATEGSFAAYLMYQARVTSWFLPDDEGSPPLLFGEPVPVPTFLREARMVRLDAVRRWGARWHLQDWWCLFVAGKTVLGWCAQQFKCDLDRIKQELEREPDGLNRSPDTFNWSSQYSLGSVEWSHFYQLEPIALADDEKRITFPDFDWEPQLELRLEARNRVADDLLRLLDSQLDRIEDAATRVGLERAPRKDSGDVHFWWLARWQVGHESYARIARDPGIDGSDGLSEEAVRQAVTVAASRIELTRRQRDPGGAPRKPRPPSTITVNHRPR